MRERLGCVLLLCYLFPFLNSLVHLFVLSFTHPFSVISFNVCGEFSSCLLNLHVLFSISQVLSRIGFYNMSVNRNSMCHAQGEALKNQSAFSTPLTQQPWKPHVERTESWGGKNLDSWVPANWHWTWCEREISSHCVEPLGFVGSLVTTASSRLTQLISLSPLLFAKLASW